jgi:DNA-directed RNA polymerase III subunit RPC1
MAQPEHLEPLEFSKAPFAEVNAPRKIRSVRFSLMSPQEIGKCGVFHVFERNLYQMPQRVPLPNGILDLRMVGGLYTSCCTSRIQLTHT